MSNSENTKEKDAVASAVDAIVMPAGCEKTPMGFPLMAEAFFSFASVAITEDEVISEFKKDTGIDLKSIIPRSPIDKMVLDSMSYQKDTMNKFLDWLIENYWGEQA